MRRSKCSASRWREYGARYAASRTRKSRITRALASGCRDSRRLSGSGRARSTLLSTILARRPPRGPIPVAERPAARAQMADQRHADIPFGAEYQCLLHCRVISNLMCNLTPQTPRDADRANAGGSGDRRHDAARVAKNQPVGGDRLHRVREFHRIPRDIPIPVQRYGKTNGA
jgi:hypothetical protein